jgi:diacylglycerol O-acyltransferase
MARTWAATSEEGDVRPFTSGNAALTLEKEVREGTLMGAFMRDTDAFSWYMERDPTLRSTVVAIAWLEASPDWDILVDRLEAATRLIPMFRQRIVDVPGRLAPPRWTTDDQFDLTWHLRRMDSPPPHTPDAVLTIARNAVMTGFDASHPLWEFTLVEHLEGGRAALVMKLHHSLTDGLGGMQLALLLYDMEATSAPVADVERPAGERLGAADLIRESVVRNAGLALSVLASGARTAASFALRATRDPVRSAEAAARTVQSIGRTVAPLRETLSPIMKERSQARHLETIEVRLADLKRAAAAAGGTVNDGFMTSVTGGLRRYHEHHGAPVAELRVTMPISIRTPDDPIGGNRITLIRFPVPTADPDPTSRIREISRRCRTASEERSLPYTNAIAASLNLLPSGVVGSMLKHVDFVASDVPGFPVPVYLAGARVEGYVAFGPTIGASVNLTLLSYAGTCRIGVSIDTAAVPDPEVLAECLREGFEELLDLGGPHEPVRLPFLDEDRRRGTPAVTARSVSRRSSAAARRPDAARNSARPASPSRP